MRGGKQKRKSTIVDVAQRAGVSLGTASRVLNNRRGVDPELRRKVMDAARTLRYVRAANARPAARESAPTVTFILSNRDFLHPVHARMLQGADEYCAENGYFVVFKKFDYSAQLPAEELVLPAALREHNMADCLILAGTNYPNLIEATELAGVPYVLYRNNLVGEPNREPRDQVRSDDYSGALEAVRYLVQLGHRKIAFIGDISQPWYEDRYRGYCEVMHESRLKPVAQTVALSNDNFQNGSASAEVVLQQNPDVTALFASADDVAQGVWQLLQQKNLRVPDDISLLGFGDVPYAIHKGPGLTTVRIPYLEIGRQLAGMAIEKAKSPQLTSPEVVVPTSLVLRDTTWPHQQLTSQAS